MKYLYKDKIYDSISRVLEDFCCLKSCTDCIMNKKIITAEDCRSFCLRNEKEAAEIMGAVPLDGPDAVAKSERERILNEAKRCVCGDRDQQYGSPENSFKVIAELWTPYLKEKCVSHGADVCVLPEDVAAMMVLFKMARVATGQTKADNWIDAAGYAACGGEIESSKENQQEDEDDEN